MQHKHRAARKLRLHPCLQTPSCTRWPKVAPSNTQHPAAIFSTQQQHPAPSSRRGLCPQSCCPQCWCQPGWGQWGSWARATQLLGQKLLQDLGPERQRSRILVWDRSLCSRDSQGSAASILWRVLAACWEPALLSAHQPALLADKIKQ